MMNRMTSAPSPEPAAASTTPAAPARPGRALGIVAFVAGVATVLIDALTTLIYPMVLLGSDYNAGTSAVVAAVGAASGILNLLLGLVAVVLGIIVLVRRGAPKGFAAAGTALGAAALVHVAFSGIQSLLYTLL